MGLFEERANRINAATMTDEKKTAAEKDSKVLADSELEDVAGGNVGFKADPNKFAPTFTMPVSGQI